MIYETTSPDGIRLRVERVCTLLTITVSDAPDACAIALTEEQEAELAARLTTARSDEFRASERKRMAPMREAARKESFVQGWMRGKYGDPSKQTDDVLLAALGDADAAYVELIKHRGPA
jgi:hypothetical protein